MTIIYTTQPIPNEINRSIFLAGPSLRSHQSEMVSWREKALSILEALEYDGVVFVPESENGCYTDLSYETVHAWETKCLNIADNIFFFINRNVEDGLLGLTTNNEFGQWMDSGKCVLATPIGADSVRYQEAWAKELNVPVFHDIYEGLKKCIELQQDYETRTDGLRNVPLQIWNTPMFQSWLADCKRAGNTLQDAKVLKTFRTPTGKVFAYSMWMNVFIQKENRFKNNEFVVSRPDIASCVMYYLRPNPLDCEVVIVSEFRTPVSNREGMVYELPGGSSVKPGTDALQTVTEEISEETGFEVDPKKVEFVEALQLAATMLTHKCHLYKYQLDRYELDSMLMKQGSNFGKAEDTELTYLHVYKVRDIISSGLMDWSNIGMILKVVGKEID